MDELRELLKLAGALDGDDEAALRAALRQKTLRRCIADTPALQLPAKSDCLVLTRTTAAQRSIHAASVTGGGNALARLNRARHLLSAPSAVDAEAAGGVYLPTPRAERLDAREPPGGPRCARGAGGRRTLLERPGVILSIRS